VRIRSLFGEASRVGSGEVEEMSSAVSQTSPAVVTIATSGDTPKDLLRPNSPLRPNCALFYVIVSCWLGLRIAQGTCCISVGLDQ